MRSFATVSFPVERTLNPLQRRIAVAPVQRPGLSYHGKARWWWLNIGPGMFRRNRHSVHWQGCEVRIDVDDELDDRASFVAELRAIARRAPTLAHVSRDLNDLAQELGFLLDLDPIPRRDWLRRREVIRVRLKRTR